VYSYHGTGGLCARAHCSNWRWPGVSNGFRAKVGEERQSVELCPSPPGRAVPHGHYDEAEKYDSAGNHEVTHEGTQAVPAVGPGEDRLEHGAALEGAVAQLEFNRHTLRHRV